VYITVLRLVSARLQHQSVRTPQLCAVSPNNTRASARVGYHIGMRAALYLTSRSDHGHEKFESQSSLDYAYARFSDAYNTPPITTATPDHHNTDDLRLHQHVVGTPMKAIKALLDPSCQPPLSGAVMLRNLSKKLEQGAPGCSS
jgi:hypothetical protein